MVYELNLFITINIFFYNFLLIQTVHMFGDEIGKPLICHVPPWSIFPYPYLMESYSPSGYPNLRVAKFPINHRFMS